MQYCQGKLKTHTAILNAPKVQIKLQDNILYKYNLWLIV